jgi:hypothetical protein
MGATRVLQMTEHKQRQQSLERELNAELDAVVAGYDDGGLKAEDVTRAEDVGRLNDLEKHRLRYFDLNSPQQCALAEWAASHPAPPREPTVYPVSDGAAASTATCIYPRSAPRSSASSPNLSAP